MTAIGPLVAAVLLALPVAPSAAAQTPERLVPGFDAWPAADAPIPSNELPQTVRASIAAADAECVGRGGKPGQSPGFLRTADFNQDGIRDYVTDLNNHQCHGAAPATASAGSPKALTIYLGTVSNGATQAYATTVYASQIQAYRGEPLLFVSIDGPDCGRADAANIMFSRWEYCVRPLDWRPATQGFGLGSRMSPAAAGATARKAGDDAEAARLWTLGVSQGDMQSMVELGDAYAFGMGVPKDGARALALYRQAAEAEATDISSKSVKNDAMRQLFTKLTFGVGDEPPNEAEAAIWLRRYASAVGPDPEIAKLLAPFFARLNIQP